MPKKLPRMIDGIYRETVEFVHDTWKNNPFRIPTLLIIVLLTTTASLNLFYNPKSPIPTEVKSAKANTYQYAPTSGELVTGTEQNTNSGAAASNEGINTGFRGTLADDNFHWQVTMLDAGTDRLNMQLSFAGAKLTGTNKMILQTEFDADIATRLITVQICDWVSSTSVDAAADSQCTTGGWRTINTQNASNADVTIGITTPTAFQWHIYDGYFTTGTTGGTAVSTPLTNFTNSDANAVKIRYFSQSAITGTADFAVDYARLFAMVDSVYHPAGFTNSGSGTPAGTYVNADVIGNSSTAQQSTTTADGVYLAVPGTAGTISDFYLTFKNIQTYTGMNTIYVKADYSCSAATAGLSAKPAIYNFNSSAWEDLTTTAMACATGDATNAWAKNNVTFTNYLSTGASGGDIRIRWYGTANSATSLRLDFMYIMVGTTNSDSAKCEVSFGTGTATNCTKTRDLDGTTTPTTTTAFQNAAEDESNTFGHAYYAKDNDGDGTVEEAAASNITFSVTTPSNGQVVGLHYAGRYSGCAATNSLSAACGATAMSVQNGLKDYSGRISVLGGWTQVGSANGSTTLIANGYTDSITALAIGTYGLTTQPEAYINTTSNEMNVRLATTASGTSTANVTAVWDFEMVSIAWYPDSSHPTRLHEYSATSGTLATGTTGTILAATAAAAGGVNTGGYQGTLADDNYHWTVNGANVVGTNHDVQLNFDNVELYGANKMIIQTAFDTDAATLFKVQVCDWVSTTSVDNAADSNCTGGGWRTINSQNASNADVDIGLMTNDTTYQWHIFDGYFTTGTTGGSAISTPLYNFIKNDSTKRVKLRYYSTFQTATAIDIDFSRIQMLVDTVYHPAGFTNLGSGTAAGTYANAHIVGNSASAQQSVTAGNAVYLAVPGTAGSISDFRLDFNGVKTYAGANTIYVKADYSCSAATGGLSQKPAIYNFSSASWEDLTTTAMACATGDVTNAWAKNNVTVANYISGGQIRIRWYGTANSTTSLRLDFIYVMLGSTNADSAQCEITFGTGTATNCTNSRDLDGTATANRFDNPAEDESTTMGTGLSNSFYAMDDEAAPDTTIEESASANVNYPVTLPANSAPVAVHFADRYSGCGATGNNCGSPNGVTVQPGIRDYSGLTSVVGGWTQVGTTSGTSTYVYADPITALTATAAANSYGININADDYIDTLNGYVNTRLVTTAAGTSTGNSTTVWDFGMVSIAWIEIGATIDISGSSSVTGATVAVAVNGILQTGKTTTTTGTCPCAWTISAVWVGTGRPVLVWHDGATDANESTGITDYDGSGNITGMQLTAHTFSIGSADDQTKDFSELLLYDNDDDEDIMYKANGSTLDVDATSTYTDEKLDILSGDTLTIGASETVNTLDLSINGTLTSGGGSTYNISGAWTNAGTFNESTSTVNLIGLTSQNLDSGCSNTDTCTAQNFYNLTINKTDASSANDNITLTTNGIRVTNTLTITDGELIQGTLNVRVEGTSAVSVAATGTWTNISTGDLKLGGTFVNNGSVTFNSNNGTQCTDAADDIAISSTSGGSVRTWSGSGTEIMYNLAVTDMADSTVTAYTSLFTNTTWTAGNCSINIQGVVYKSDESTLATSGNGGPCDGSAAIISIRVNGGTATTGSCNISTAAYSINVTPIPSSGDRVTIYLTSTMKANRVYITSGVDITGMDLYDSRVAVSYQTGSSITIANMTDYDQTANATDMLYDAVTGPTALTVASGNELHIPTTINFTPGGNVTTPKMHLIGTYTGASENLTISGTGTGTSRPLYINGGTFTPTSNTTIFTGTAASDIEATTYNNLQLYPTSGTETYTLNSGTLATNGNLSVNNGGTLTVNVDTNDPALNIAGNLTLNTGTTWTASASAALTLKPTGTKTVTDSNATKQNLGLVTIGSGASTPKIQLGSAVKLTNLTISATHELDVVTGSNYAIETTGSWSNSGTFTAQNGTVTFSATSSGKTLAGTMTGSTGKFYNLIFNGVSGAWSYSAAVEAANDFQVSNGAVTASNNNLTVGRDFTLDNTAGVGYTAGSSIISIARHFNDTGDKLSQDTSTVTMSGTGTITHAANETFYKLSTAPSGGTTTISANPLFVDNELSFNGGTATGSGSYLNVRCSVSCTPVVFNSASTLNGTEDIFWRADAASLTLTITGANYGSWGIIAYAATGNNSTWQLGGNVTTTSPYGPRLEAETGITGSIFTTTASNYNLTSGALYIAPCGPSRTGSWTVNLNDSVVTLSNTTNSLYVGTNCGSHTLNLNTSDVTVSGAVKFVDGTSSVTVNPGTSDFRFTPPASTTKVYTPNGQSLYNMYVNGGNAAATIQAGGAVDVNNDFTISAGTYDVSGSNYNLTIGGSYTNNGTFTAQGGTVFFDSSATGKTLNGTMTGSSDDFYNLVFNGVSGAWTFNAAVDVANDFTVSNGTVTANGNNLTVTRDFTLANTTGVSYVSDSTKITVSRNWTDTGLKHSFGTSTVIMNGTGTVTAASSNDDFYNLSIAYPGKVTSMGDYLRLANNGVITFNGGTVNNLSAYRIYLNSTTSNTPIVFASPTTITGVDWNINVNAAAITVTLPAGDYGSPAASGIGVAYRNNTTPTSATVQFGGNITTTSDFNLGTQNAGNSMTVNTQGYSLTAKSLSLGTCLGFGCTNPVSLNLGASTLTLGVNGLNVNSNAGSHTLDMGSSSVLTAGDVKFVNGTGTIAVTPGTSTLTWNHSSGTKTYTPNGQSLYNLTLNCSGGTVQPAGTVDVNNDFTITAGTYDTVSGSNYALTVGHDFSNSGTFTAQNGTVTLDGSTKQTLSGTITGSSAFYNLTVSNSSGADASDCERTGFTPSIDFNVAITATNNLTWTTASTRFEFNSGSTYTFNNINWNGQASGTRIYFRNSATSGTWLLKVTGTQTAVSYINVSRSDASVAGGSTINASDGTNVDCTVNTNWNFGTPTFDQSAYRFASNQNNTDVSYSGAPAQDTALTVTSTGQQFRLRMLLHVGASNVAINGQNFKLQYGERTAANCTTGVSWGDVATGSGVIRYYNNSTPVDEDDLTGNAGDPTHSGHTINNQDYEEANNFTNSVSAINSGQDGKWDFSLENNSAVGGKIYCFRATKSDGTALDTYSVYPQVVIDEELVFSLDATSKDFGLIQPGANPTSQSSTLTVSTNSSTGYVIYGWATQAMTRGSFTIPDWSGSNGTPTTWPNGSFGFGYTTDDASLTGGTADRFTNGGAKYAGFGHSGPGDPVADRTSGPTSSQQNIVTYQVAGSGAQQSGTYTTVIVYVASATF